MLPLVALIGRPNVGKSALFNRLTGDQRAIVSDIAGTTRDRLFGIVKRKQQAFTLVDTGGLTLDTTTEIETNLAAQTRLAIADADLVILVVDVKTPLTHEDEKIWRDLVRAGKNPLLVVNKCDNEREKMDSVEFYRLGAEELFPISVSHDLGTNELLSAIFERLPAELEEEEKTEETIKLVFLGKPNVGKSSLVNALLGEPRLLVSNVAGTTRDATDHDLTFQNQSFRLLDTAGLRQRGRVAGLEKYSALRSLRALERADIGLLVLDAEVGIEKTDLSASQYILEANKSLIIVVNKWDLAREKVTMEEYEKFLRQRLRYLSWAPIVFVSAKDNWHLTDLLTTAQTVYNERHRRLTTSELNRFLREAVYNHAPSGKHRSPPKVYYATQTDVNPPHFVFFVNDAKSFHFSYRRYMINKLREKYGFSGTPLLVDYKGKKDVEDKEVEN